MLVLVDFAIFFYYPCTWQICNSRLHDFSMPHFQHYAAYLSKPIFPKFLIGLRPNHETVNIYAINLCSQLQLGSHM